jgi:hypothetical protein
MAHMSAHFFAGPTTPSMSDHKTKRQGEMELLGLLARCCLSIEEAMLAL